MFYKFWEVINIERYKFWEVLLYSFPCQQPWEWKSNPKSNPFDCCISTCRNSYYVSFCVRAYVLPCLSRWKSNKVCWICSNLGTLEIQLSFDLSVLLKLSRKDDGIFQCHASTLSKISRLGLRCITANCDIAHHLSFLSWLHVYLVSKGVFYEMFDGYVVDTQCKLRYSKIFGELKDLLFDLLWCYVLLTQKDKIHQN